MTRHPTQAIDHAELPPRLRTQGGKFIKPNGSEIILRGVNYGAWGDDDPNDSPYIQSIGANCVRIALRWWGTWGEGGRANPDSRDNNAFAFMARDKINHWLDLIQSVSATGMWVVPFIDSNCGQSGTNSPEDVAYCDVYGTWGANGHNFYTDPAMRRVFAQVVWAAAAARLRLIPRIAMLEIHPEPAHHRGPEWAPQVAKVQRECIDAIRAEDPDTPILIGAREGYDIRYIGEAVDALAATGPLDNVVITGNLLNQWIVNPDRFDKGLKKLTDAREKYGLCAFVQQLGRNSSEDPDLSLMREALASLQAASMGFTWWEWKQHTGNPGSMGLNYKTPDGAGWIAKQNEIDLLSEYFKSHA